jgi:hypothetical protein
MPEVLRHTQLKSNSIDLYIANFSGASTISFGLSKISAVYSYLTDKIRNQIGPINYGSFQDDFINYDKGLILCVNTYQLLSKDFYKQSGPICDALKFTVIKMPEEFKSISTNLSSRYAYGERLRVLASFEKTLENSITKTLVYRDSNIKGRSKSGTASNAGVGVGVWS